MAFNVKLDQFKLSKLNQREKKLLGFMLLALSSIPFFQFTLPTWNKYIESSTKVKEGHAKLKDLESRIKGLEKLKKENLEISKKIDVQKLYLAKDYEIDFLVQDLKKICDESSISLESFTPSNPEPINIVLEKQLIAQGGDKSSTQGKLRQVIDKLKGQDLPIDLYRYPIEVRITGNFSDIIELFKKLEKYGRVISVENITIGKVQTKQGSDSRTGKSKTKKQPDGGLISTFNLVAYSLPDSDETLSTSELKKGLVTSMSTFTFKKRSRK